MSYRSLREFIAKLESEHELVRVREPVSSVLELTEIQTRLIAEQGPAASPITAKAASSKAERSEKGATW